MLNKYLIMCNGPKKVMVLGCLKSLMTFRSYCQMLNVPTIIYFGFTNTNRLHFCIQACVVYQQPDDTPVNFVSKSWNCLLLHAGSSEDENLTFDSRRDLLYSGGNIILRPIFMYMKYVIAAAPALYASGGCTLLPVSEWVIITILSDMIS